MVTLNPQQNLINNNNQETNNNSIFLSAFQPFPSHLNNNNINLNNNFILSTTSAIDDNLKTFESLKNRSKSLSETTQQQIDSSSNIITKSK